MRPQLRRAIAATLGALCFVSCGGSKSPLQPSLNAATLDGRVGPAAGASAETSIPWHCLTPTTLWQAAGCPVRSTRTLGLANAGLIAPGAPSNLSQTVSSSRVTLTWTAAAGGDAPASYVVEAGSTTGRVDLANFDTASTSTILVVDSVPGGTYFVRVRARNSGGASSASNEVVVSVGGATTCATRPIAPGSLAATVTGSSIVLLWAAPVGGCAATSYSVEAGSSSGLSNLAIVSTGSAATSFSASGIATGTYFVRVRAVNTGGQSAASNEVSLTVGAAAPTTSCASWASQQRGAGVPPAPGSFAAMRQSFYEAGGGIRAVGTKYYAAYFPASFSTASPRRVLVALHGTGGAPEQQWSIDWQAQVQARGYGFLALKYLDDNSGAFDDETTIYANLKTMIDEVRASCDVQNTTLFLVGFSRGSAESIPVGYLDLVDRRFFTAVGNNSGAWGLDGPPPPTLQAIQARGDRTAMSGIRYWMYCGELDFNQGFPMCDGMAQARDFLQTYGAMVAALYRDPTGAHGGLTRNSDALSQMFGYFESLR